jgi:hypothetical protein
MSKRKKPEPVRPPTPPLPAAPPLKAEPPSAHSAGVEKARRARRKYLRARREKARKDLPEIPKRAPNAQALRFQRACVIARESRKKQPGVKWSELVKDGYALVLEQDEG